MMIGVIACFFGVTTASILTASAGALTEIISGTILVFLTRSPKVKEIIIDNCHLMKNVINT